MTLAEWSRDKIQKIADACGKGIQRLGPEASSNLRVDPNTPVNKARYVVIDTELTGLDRKRDSIISIGAVRMVGSRIDLGDSFYRLVSPEAELTGETVLIHGITPSDVQGEPQIAAILPQLLDFCGRDIIVGFHPMIDLGFLNRDMEKIGGSSIKNPVIDVSIIYRWVKWRSGVGCPPIPSLYGIAYDFDIAARGAHNALFDAFITAQVMQRLLYLLSTLGITSVGELLDVSNPSKGGGKFDLSGRITNL